MASQGLVESRTTLLATGDIIVDEHLYPRGRCDTETVTRYVRALEAGRTFPPIVVGRQCGRYVLIDGRHRLRAYQQLSAKQVQVEISLSREADFFAEAVRLNAAHGTPLKADEVVEAAQRLARQDWSPERIATVVALPVEAVRKILVTSAARPRPMVRSVDPVRSSGSGRSFSRDGSLTPLPRGFTIESALEYLGEQVHRGIHRKATRMELETWIRRANYLAEAFGEAIAILAKGKSRSG